MKEIEVKITESGVKSHVRLKNRKFIVTDIDIDDNVDTLVFGINEKEVNFKLRDINKVFPNVTKFFIMPNVKNIEISNNMFPNVRAVASFCGNYETCSMLISHGHLLNSFCLKGNEVLDLNDIKYIDAYALSGCCAGDIKCDENGTVFLQHSIDDSIYAHAPSVDGVKVYKNIIVGIDENAQDVILHNDNIFNYCFNDKKLKSLQISNIKQLNSLYQKREKTFEVENLIIDTEVPVDKFQLMDVATNLNVKDIVIKNKNQNLRSIDGVLYGKCGQTLYYVPKGRTRKLIIPEGVTTVIRNAAQGSCIDSVSLPKSLTKIEHGAFAGSNISFAKFQNSQTIIEAEAFCGCKKLAEVMLPKVSTLSNYVFCNCPKLSKITFREGIKTIGISSFSRCESLKEIEFPKSLETIYSNNFEFLEKITLKGTTIIDGLQRLITCKSKNISYTVLNFKGKKIYIPKDYPFDINIMCDKIMSGETRGYYDKSKNPTIKQDTALAEYLEYRQPDLRKYIRRSSKSIVERYFDGNLQKQIITLIDCDLVTKTTLDYIIEEADKRDLTTLKAYAVDKTQNYAKTGFKL